MKQTICPNCGGSLESVAIGWRCKKCKGFISLQDGKFYEYVKKPFMPPMTNADRIRAMSDEELAVFVRAVVIADGCPNGDVDCKECPVFAICNQSGLYGHEMEWLKQPVED